MSVLADKLATLTTAVTNLEARVTDAVPTQGDLDTIDVMTARVDAILPTPVPPVEPPVEPVA